MGVKYQLFSIFLLCSLAIVNGQVPRWGRCPDIPVQQNFSVDSYMGQWFEYQRFFAIFELGVKCATANYSQIDDSTVSVLNTGINKWFGRKTVANGTATIPDPSEPAKLKVRFSRYQPAGNYWVIATDYSTYSLVYSCMDLYFMHTDIAWILTRDRSGISDTVTNELHQLLKQYGINPNSFRTTDQTGCTI